MSDHIRTVVFRFDASPSIGHGHAGRCLSLAAALRDHGCRIVLIAAGLTGPLRARALELGCELRDLASPCTTPDPTCTTCELNDAEHMVAICKRDRLEPSWIVVDGYYFGTPWHTVAERTGARLLCIDDLANRPLRCAALVDQNLVIGWEHRYDGLIPDSCRTFLGPTYALLSPEYARLRHTRRPEGRPRRILVSFGGADPIDATAATVNAIMRLDDPALEVDVVLSAAHRCFEAVQRMAMHDSRIRLHQPLPTLAPLLVQASVAVGGAGVTSWERLCLNVPTVAIPLADNQRPIAEALADHNLAVVVDPDDPDLTHRLEVALRDALAKAGSSRSSDEFALVDGKGAGRVAGHMVLSCSM